MPHIPRRVFVSLAVLMASAAVTFGVQLIQHQAPTSNQIVALKQDTSWNGASHHGAQTASWCGRCTLSA